MRAQSMKGCHSCIVRNSGCFGASRPRKMLSDGVLASPPVVPSGARGNHKPNTQKSTMRIAGDQGAAAHLILSTGIDRTFIAGEARGNRGVSPASDLRISKAQQLGRPWKPS